MVTVGLFKEHFEEFRDTSPNLVQKKIEQATANVNADFFGDNTEWAIMLRTAHYLSLSPTGENARLKLTGGMGLSGPSTMYEREFQTLCKQVVGYGRAN